MLSYFAGIQYAQMNSVSLLKHESCKSVRGFCNYYVVTPNNGGKLLASIVLSLTLPQLHLAPLNFHMHANIIMKIINVYPPVCPYKKITEIFYIVRWIVNNFWVCLL